MKTVIPFPDNTRIQDEAAAWLVRLDRGNLDSAEREALRAWLAADERHDKALQQMAHLWDSMDCLMVLAELFPGQPLPQRHHRLRWWPAAAAAVIAIAAVGLLQLRTPAPSALDNAAVAAAPAELVYRTALGQRSVIPLQDGSVLTLNTQSEVRVRFDTATRTVQLTRGEAHFNVASNKQRPFIVRAGHGAVRAIGTAFNVKLLDQGDVEVLVDEGTVEVLPTATEAAATASQATSSAVAVHVSAGNGASYKSDATRAESLADPPIERKLAWRDGKWIFEGETLAEVIAEVARYSDRSIVIDDPSIARLRIGGYFNIGDVDGLMHALEAGFGIRVTQDGQTLRLMAGKRGTDAEADQVGNNG